MSDVTGVRPEFVQRTRDELACLTLRREPNVRSARCILRCIIVCRTPYFCANRDT